MFILLHFFLIPVRSILSFYLYVCPQGFYLLDYRGADIFLETNINPLSIPPVVISLTNGNPKVKPKTLDNILQRVGLCLQKILKNEYGDAYEGDLTKKNARKIMETMNPRLAHLTPSQALSSLKSELKAYADCDDPFDREFHKGETVQAWWVAVQKKQFGKVLRVCFICTPVCGPCQLTARFQALSIKLYLIVVVSMEDERTMSTITWLNSARRSRQEVATVHDHVQIRGWHRNNPKVCSIYYLLIFM